MDAVPVAVSGLGRHELATHKLDTDYLISAVLARLGGIGTVSDPVRRVLRSASEWCDLLESDEPDDVVRESGLALHLFIVNKQRRLEEDLCRRRNEYRRTPDGRSVPDPSDETLSLVATLLARDLMHAIRSQLRGTMLPGVPTLDDLKDPDAERVRSEHQQRWRDGVRANDDQLAVVVVDRDVEALYCLELVRGKLQILAIPKLHPDGRPKGTKFRISLKPASYGHVDLRDLLPLFNSLDPHVQDQRPGSSEVRREWGGRDVVVASAYEIESGLSIDQVEAVTRSFLRSGG